MTTHKLESKHVYAVVSVDMNAHTITLRNPWGSDGPRQQGADDGVITVSWAVFGQVMQGFCAA